jgi:hypothetical protein
VLGELVGGAVMKANVDGRYGRLVGKHLQDATVTVGVGATR